MTQAAKNEALTRLWRGCQFELSAAQMRDLPRTGREVAFAGRSNAGKSTALNVLTDQKSLARASKTPGRTQLINLFSLNEDWRLTDLPGYGFAKAPRAVQQQWTVLIEKYFSARDELVGVVLIVDIRRGITDLDEQLLGWIGPRFIPVHVLLTKADKLSRNVAKQSLFEVERRLKQHNPLHTAQLFSAPAKQGIEEARARIADMLEGAVSE